MSKINIWPPTLTPLNYWGNWSVMMMTFWITGMWGSARKVQETLTIKVKKSYKSSVYFSIQCVLLKAAVFLFCLFFLHFNPLSNFKMLLDEGAQLLPYLQTVFQTHVYSYNLHTPNSVCNPFFSRQIWLKACLQRGFLSERVSRLSQLMWICHKQAAADRYACPGWAANQNPSTGRGVHPPRGSGLSLLSQLWVWSEEWWCGWREAVSLITMSKSCNSRSPCLCQRLPAPFLSSFLPFAQPLEKDTTWPVK